MARPPGITDEEVLAAARAVLLAKGVGATVEEVAERCHVGVATIFRRFPTKQALFTAAMSMTNDEEWTSFLARRAENAQRKRGAPDPRQNLLDLAQTMLVSLRKIMPLMMMRIATSPLMDKEHGAARAKWILQSLTDFFRQEIEAGNVREMDPRVAARVWLGAIRQIVLFESVGVDDFPANHFIEGLVDMYAVPTRKPRKKSRSGDAET
jgi:AcrR family transcriptional regulator